MINEWSKHFPNDFRDSQIVEKINQIEKTLSTYDSLIYKEFTKINSKLSNQVTAYY